MFLKFLSRACSTTLAEFICVRIRLLLADDSTTATHFFIRPAVLLPFLFRVSFKHYILTTTTTTTTTNSEHISLHTASQPFICLCLNLIPKKYMKFHN